MPESSAICPGLNVFFAITLLISFDNFVLTPNEVFHRIAENHHVEPLEVLEELLQCNFNSNLLDRDDCRAVPLVLRVQ